VRPVEDEQKLQKLQKLDDSELREEFLNQVNKLRNKIFTKVKVKTLNGRQLNGKMLLELAFSYT